MCLLAVYPSLLWPEVKIRTNKNICWYSLNLILAMSIKDIASHLLERLK